MHGFIDRRAFLVGATAAVVVGTAAVRVAAKPRSMPVPTRGLVTRWDTDPWSLGSYSALPVGSSPVLRERLARAVLAGGLVFAGEHVSTTHPATVQGAYGSGEQAAALLGDADVAGPGNTIVVIGGGVAGLSAARALRAGGATVVVLEARDRIGGRVCTDTSWGVPIELGAAWVHGVRHNPITRLVISGGSSLVPSDYGDEIIRGINGGAVVGADAAQARLAGLVARMQSRPYPITASARDVLRAAGWRRSVVNDWCVETELTQEYGLDPARLGAAALYEGAEQIGGDALVAGGYDVVPQRLAEGVDVRLKTPVRRVDGTVDAGFVVTLRSGTQVEADGVVVAVPLAVLQQGGLRIGPMTTSVRRALGGLAMGSLQKVVLQYADRWWPDAQVLGVVGPPGRRWTEWYDLSVVVGAPTVVGFSAGAAAATRPRSDAACIDEAAAVFAAAFA